MYVFACFPPSTVASFGEVAHLAQIELTFLLSTTLQPYVREDQISACRGIINKLKALAADGIDPDDDAEGILDYSSNHLEKVMKMPILALTHQA